MQEHLWTDIATIAKTSLKDDFKLELDHWYHLKGVANDDNFDFCVDGELLIPMKDSRVPTGFMTIEVAGSVAYIDNVVITGDDVPGNSSAVSNQGKLATSWGQMKSR